MSTRGMVGEPRRALTLVELMVMIAVIALLIGLILPAVLKAREAARRAHCLGSLKQIGLSIHNYHDSYGVLPPGVVNGWAPSFVLIPFLESSPLYNSTNLNFGEWEQRSYGQSNWTVCSTEISFYQCPTDVDRLTTPQGHGNYAGNIGSDGNSLGVNGPYNGPFSVAVAGPSMPGAFSNSRPAISLRDVLDGTSTTAAYSERVKGVGGGNDGSGNPDRSRPSGTFSLANTDTGDPSKDYAACLAAPPFKAKARIARGSPSGGYWSAGDPADALYSHVMPPNTWSCAAGFTGGPGVASTASSRHDGIVNVLMLDGSVHSVGNPIAVKVWQGYGTIDGSRGGSSDY